MKLMQQHRSVGMSEGMTSTVFGMEVSAKAFQILLAKLYSDRIRAVIREISTNAYDSHLANGNGEEPFLVHLPTYLEPTFWVRDYGTGLSAEEIESIYFTVFKSSKTEDENSTGCLGLGSKSPLSYTDSFMVESYQNGKRNVYAVHYNDENLPCTTPMGSFDTDERNGIKVSVSVQSGDCSVFVSKARDIYRHFKVKPTIVGAECVIETRTPVLSGNGWASFGNGGAGVVMSNVFYPLRADSQYFTEEQNTLIRSYGLELYFENGKISFEPSRENLSYDKPTILAIKNRLNETLVALLKATQDELDACPNLFEARHKYWEIVQKNPSIDNFSGKLKYRNLKFIAHGFSDWFGRVSNYSYDTIIDAHTLSFRHTKIKEHRPHSTFRINKSVVLIDLDDEKFWKKKVRTYCQASPGKEYFLFRFKNEEERQTVCALFGCDDSYLVKVSALNLPPKGTSLNNSNSVGQVNVYGYHDLTSHCWTPEEVDFEDIDGIYVEILSGSVIYPTGNGHANKLEDIKGYLNRLGIKIDKIYGIKKKSIEQVKEHDNWVLLWDYIKTSVTKYITDNNLEVATQYINSHLGYSDESFVNNLKKLTSGLDNSHAVVKLCEESVTKDSYESKYESIIPVLNNLKRETNLDISVTNLPKIDFDKMLSDLSDKYPLLRKLASDDYALRQENYKNHCLFYINQVDKEMK